MFPISQFGGASVMSHINQSMKKTCQEVGISKNFPITHFNSPTILESKDGAIFSVIKLLGVPFDTEKTDTLNAYKRTWHRALCSLNENFAILGTIHRKKGSAKLTGNFTNPLSKSINDSYMKQFDNQSMYVNDLYLTIVHKGVTTGNVGRLTNFFKKISGRYIKDARELRRNNSIKKLNDAVSQLAVSLSDFNPTVLGENDGTVGHSELLKYISLFVNAGEPLRFKAMTSKSTINKSFKKSLSSRLLYPHGNISQFVTTKRLFFGDYIQFQGSSHEETKFGAILTVKRYGSESACVMLDPLLHLECEFISTNSFAIESKPKCDTAIERHFNKLKNANDPAVTQIEELQVARDMLASDRMVMGFHHNTVMLISNSTRELDQQISSAIKCYMDAGIVAVRETLGQEPAYWAQIPTNFKFIARSSLISSQNFVDFFSLHNYRTGFFDGNHLGSALTIVETPSKTPLWFNLHARGPRDNEAPGHATLIGGNGSGKTVTMCFLDAQLNRYGGRSFFFDRNRGAEIYIRACGGYYAVLSPDHESEICFNPFQLEDSPTNRKFCKDWLVQLVKKEDELEVDEKIVDQLGQCVNYAYDQLAPEHRNLSHAVKVLPITFERWIRLRRWLKGDESRPDGEYAYLFDNQNDALVIADKMGFDMTHFLDNEPPAILAAVTMYLFHRLELSLNKGGKLVSVFLDEAWQYLDNDYWKTKLKKWLPTLRKLNCHLVFATQSPKSVCSSPISHTILDNCATNLYFANPQAKEEHYREGFNLTESEFSCIKDNEPQSRIFLYKQGHESALGRLNLGHLKSLLRIMSGTQETVNLLTTIRQEVGDDPQYWLPIFLEKSGLENE